MIVVATLICAVAIRRYIRMLGRAESLAEQCVCPDCATYGVIRVLEAGRVDDDEQPQWIRVSCKKCNREWRLQSI